VTDGVLVTGGALRAADVVRVARELARVELSAEAEATIEASRAVVDRLVAGERLIYGLNTGLGHMRDSRSQLIACSSDVVMTLSSKRHSGQPVVIASVAKTGPNVVECCRSGTGFGRGAGGRRSDQRRTHCRFASTTLSPWFVLVL